MAQTKKKTVPAESVSLAPASPQPSHEEQFTLGLHLQKSWTLFKSAWKMVLALQAAGCAIGCLLSAVVFLIVGVLITLGGLSLTQLFGKGELGSLPAVTPAFPIALGVLIVVLIVAYCIALAIESLVFQNATIHALFHADDHPTFGESVKRGYQTSWKAFFYTFIAVFLVSGGLWLFMIPGMIIGLFLTFSLYVIVYENKGPFAAIRRSYELVRADPWLTLGHVVILGLIGAGIGFFSKLCVQLLSIPFIALGDEGQTLGVIALFPFNMAQSLLTIVVGWYGMAFYVVLYRYLVKKLETQAKATYRTFWMWIVAIVGWIFFALMASLIGYAIVTYAAKRASEAKQKPQQEISQPAVTPSVPAEKTPEAPKPVVQKPVTPKPACTRYKIYEGSFKSDRCYTSADYKELMYYLDKYNDAAFQYNGAISAMRVTCNGSEFFKNACKDDKEQKEDAEDDMNDATKKIKAIIQRGTP